MDAVKILGSLLSNNALGSSKGGSILDSLLAGASGSKGGGAGDILEVLLGGQKRSSGGGMGALGAILAAAAASGTKGSKAGPGSGGALDILGSLLGSAASSGKLGGLGSLLGEAAPAQRGSGGGGGGSMLGDLVGSFLGGESKKSESGGGLGGLLGSLLGASGGSGGGGLSSILGAVGSQAGGGDLLGLLVGGGQPATPPQEAQEEATILIEAMCNAAKCDGTVDEAERSAILGKMGELDQEEIDYLRDQLASPLDLEGFLSKVSDDMDEQVYAFSLMAVRLDTQKEAEYFGQLAQGLGLDGASANAIHERLGQPEIFA